MSAYNEQATEFKDADLLCEALKTMGVSEVIRHSKAVQLEDYHGQLRPQTAEIVIPRRAVGPAANDIGFSKQPDGAYKAIISEFDGRESAYDAAWMKRLKCTYAEAGVMRQAKKAGLRFIGKKPGQNGKQQLQFVKV